MMAAVAQADPDGAVPTCPEWTVRDLEPAPGRGAPLGHRFRQGGPSPNRPTWTRWSAPGRRDAELAGWLAQGCADLVAALTEAPDALECWTFLPAPSPLRHVGRRQAHETAIHRVDAQLAAGLPLTLGAGLCRRRHRRAPCRCSSPGAARTARRSAGHVGGALRRCRRLVAATPGRARRHHHTCHGQRPGQRAVHGDRIGRAISTWRCGTAPVRTSLTVAGERSVLDRFSEVVRIRWS